MIILIILYLICVVLTYGITFSYFYNEFSLISEEYYSYSKSMGVLFALSGPIGLIFSFVFSGFAKHGLKFK